MSSFTKIRLSGQFLLHYICSLVVLDLVKQMLGMMPHNHSRHHLHQQKQQDGALAQ